MSLGMEEKPLIGRDKRKYTDVTGKMRICIRVCATRAFTLLLIYVGIYLYMDNLLFSQRKGGKRGRGGGASKYKNGN